MSLYCSLGVNPSNELDPNGLAFFQFPRENPIYNWWRDFYHNSALKNLGKDPNKCKYKDCDCLWKSFWKNTVAAAMRETDALFYDTPEPNHEDMIATALDRAARAAARLEIECREDKKTCPDPNPQPKPFIIPDILLIPYKVENKAEEAWNFTKAVGSFTGLIAAYEFHQKVVTPINDLKDTVTNLPSSLKGPGTPPFPIVPPPPVPVVP